MKAITKYAFKSKKTQNYFVWEELCDDGWGKYFDSLTEKEFLNAEMPSLFSELETTFSRNFNGHTPEEVELVKVKIAIKIEKGKTC